MIDPNRNLPRAIHLSMGTVILCFLLTNISYYILVPWDAVSLTDAIAVVSTTSHNCFGDMKADWGIGPDRLLQGQY
jgi:amino acid transporter